MNACPTTVPVTAPRILVVEDEALVAENLRRCLHDLGYVVAGIADTAKEAIGLAREHKPDLVLSDIRIKGPVDGTAAARTLSRELDVPVVFLTAHADDATLQRARQTGPFGYVVKPYSERDLRIAIEVALERHRLEQRVRLAERLLDATLRSIGDAVIATDAQGRITFMNPAAEALTGDKAGDAVGRELDTVFLTGDATTSQPVQNPTLAVIQSGEAIVPQRNQTLVARDCKRRPIDGSCAPIRDEQGRVVGGILVFRDVSERKQYEVEREKLIADLQEALAGVKTLRGLLPMCAWCKQIRDDDGYWQGVEDYIQAHSDAEFTHGICPECFEKVVPKG
ncbi:MAG TPA: response regulator [Verrucomicrobiae bacterium]|nr:response regulator [Verrucomicrobiae bacterium]